MFEPDCSEIFEILHELVPVALPEEPRLLVHDTRATETLSEAVPLMLREELPVAYVELVVGARMAIVGLTVSDGVGDGAGGTDEPEGAVVADELSVDAPPEQATIRLDKKTMATIVSRR